MENLTTEEIIKIAASRSEIPWQWGARFFGSESQNKKNAEAIAEELGLEFCWREPIRPGDLYIAARNAGPKLLTCQALGEAFIIPKEDAYCFDFSECVKVIEKNNARNHRICCNSRIS